MAFKMKGFSGFMPEGPKKTESIDDMAGMPKKGKCSCYDGYSRVKGTAPCASGSCKKSPASKKLKPCQINAAKKKFDVYPSAYANMWASNHKC